MRRGLAILAINIVLLMIVFLALELGFRLTGIPYLVEWTPSETALGRFDRELGWSYIPNLSRIIDFGVGVADVHFEANGIRVPHPDTVLSDSEPTILFIGGSFVMGHGLSFEESFVGRFAATEGLPYQVVNLGVQAYGSDQCLLSLKRHFSRFNTKIVVYVFTAGHVRRNGNYDRRMLIPAARFLGTKPLFALNDESELYLKKKAKRYDEIWKSHVVDFLIMRVGSLTHTFPPQPERLTIAIINEMNRYCIAREAVFVLLNWRWTQDDDDLSEHPLDVDVIDVLENAPSGWSETMASDQHPGPESGIHVAQLLVEHLRTMGLLDEGQRTPNGLPNTHQSIVKTSRLSE